MGKFKEGELVLIGNALHLPKEWRLRKAVVLKNLTQGTTGVQGKPPTPNASYIEPVYEVRIKEPRKLAQVPESDLISAGT